MNRNETNRNEPMITASGGQLLSTNEKELEATSKRTDWILCV